MLAGIESPGFQSGNSTQASDACRETDKVAKV